MAALAASPPFDSLASSAVEALAGLGRVEQHFGGQVILDAFRTTPRDVVIVLSGAVQTWVDPERPHNPEVPELLLGPGDVLGLDATLSGKAIGPLAVAHGPVRALHLPADAVDEALEGIDWQPLRPPLPQASDAAPGGVRAGDLVVTRPLTVSGTVSVAEVAAALGQRGVAAVDCGGAEPWVLTDRTLRERILAAGLPSDTPAQVAAVSDLPWIDAGASASEALILLLDTGADLVLVRGVEGGLLGTVDARDFIGSSVTAGLTLHERFIRAESIADLQRLARGLPQLVGHLLEGGLSSARVLTLYSALVDAIIKRMLALVFASHPDLSTDAFTWFSLGSNGRRESTLSSDVDCAVVFHDELDQADIDRYRAVFLEVVNCLANAGLTGDGHGATAAHKLFARSRGSWAQAARSWVQDPTRDNAAMLTSLLLDARALQGSANLPEVTKLFAGLGHNPGTMRLLLSESLAHRAGMRTMRRRFGGAKERFDLKKYALLPMVNLARWAALTVGSTVLPTTQRLQAASGTSVLPHRQASILIEIFEVLQSIRLRHQLTEVEQGRPPGDQLDLDRVSPIDASIIARAVKEIAAVQQRMANLARYENPEDWGRPEPLTS
ncbi:putative nucleotidyltransferase substrate binding domain-containing protein [Micropruina sp.]|uniref:putative nucleotidyltransferase substrate binding domain-containing protein n=1 Tax=Micropruina sp. TaxID=2737536 RepID=UPI0039E5CBFA